MTYSIIAKDTETGAIGLAVASRYFACGAAVPFVGANCAVATQSYVNPMWGVEGRTRLSAGEHADAVMADLIARDTGQASRQAHMLDSFGNFAAHTGSDCVDWAGHRVGEFHSVAGNMLVGADVVSRCFEAYQEAANLQMAERLLCAMEAGERAGGDKRGRQAAGLVIHHGQDYAWLNLRADDHADPLAELRRLLAVAGERYLHAADYMASRENFSGAPSRTSIDAAIAKAEAARLARNEPSQSFATDAKKAM